MKPADRVVLQDEARAVALVLMGLGVSTVVAGLAWAPDRTWPNLLLSNLYLLTLALAGALVICIQFLSGAGWAVVLRRVAEAMMSCLPVVAVMMMTVFFGRQALYPWANPDAHEALAAGKAEYLSTPFVFTRMVLVLALWVLLARAIRKTSLLQDRDQDLRHHHRLVRLSAMFAVVFALTFALASVDWVMSLDPHWYSTIFAVYLFAGLLLSGFAAVTLIVVLLRALGTCATSSEILIFTISARCSLPSARSGLTSGSRSTS